MSGEGGKIKKRWIIITIINRLLSKENKINTGNLAFF
jgi:hypothetical protein